MSTDAPPKKSRWYSRLLPASLEGRVASVTAVLLLVTVIVVWLVRWWGRDNVGWSHVMTVGRFLGELGLAILIPTILYWAMRWWSRVEREVYPDIDRAWQEGVKALHVNGLSLEELPLFLVLGSPDAEFEHQLMTASLTQPRILGVPQETTALHALRWYASSRAIYLFCTNTCALSALAQAWKPHIMRPRLAEDDVVWNWKPAPVIPPVRRPVAPQPREHDLVNKSGHDETLQPQYTASPPSSRDDETALPGNVYQPQPAALQSERWPDAAGGGEERLSERTIVPHEVEAPRRGLASVAELRREVPPPRQEAADTLASFPGIDPTAHVERLQYVCQLLRHERSPRCGINGVLTLLPLQLADASGRDLSNLAKAARTDMDIVQQILGLRSPVTSMVVGLEREKGFEEFISRLNRLDLGFRFRRLGGRFELTSRPTPEKLNKHSDRICDAFEEWIYELFRQPEAYKYHRGNRKLYWLLSRIRHELKPALRIVLGDAFGLGPDQAKSGEDDSCLFSGCYFAAIGSGPNAQDSAFVRGVLEDKMLKEQPQVEWNAQTQFRQRLFRSLVVVAWVVFGLLFALLLYRLLISRGS